MYSRNISSDIWNFSRHLINNCLLISGVFADPSRFSAENGSSSKRWLGVYPLCKGCVVFFWDLLIMIKSREGRTEIPQEFLVTVFQSVIIFQTVQTAKMEGNTVTDLHAKQ
jgi:hypothetical protein